MSLFALVDGVSLEQGSDGYHRHWKGYGQIYTGPIHEGKYGGKDYLQVRSKVKRSRKIEILRSNLHSTAPQIQDLVTGEVEYFRFRFT